MVFNWLAALAVKLDEDKLIPLLHIALLPILREISTGDEQGATIRRAAKEALKYYRQKVNSDAYDKTIIEVQRKLDTKRAQRKIKIAQMVRESIPRQISVTSFSSRVLTSEISCFFFLFSAGHQS